MEVRKQRTTEEVRKIMEFLISKKHVLSDGKLEYAQGYVPTHNTMCEIKTTVQHPRINSTPRPVNPEERANQEKIIQGKLAEKVIEPSYAPWSSNTVFIRRDGKTRMAVDYRQLNQQTVKDSYPMPRIQDLTDNLRGTKWFTGIDCVQAFHQIPMADERSKDLTTFRAPSGGLYRFRYMPFGLVNAMAVWSRFIDTVMGQYQFKFVLCYTDDCLVYTKSDNVDDHLRDVGAVLDQLHKNGIKVKASKLQLGREIPFLGVYSKRQESSRTKKRPKPLTTFHYQPP